MLEEVASYLDHVTTLRLTLSSRSLYTCRNILIKSILYRPKQFYLPATSLELDNRCKREEEVRRMDWLVYWKACVASLSMRMRKYLWYVGKKIRCVLYLSKGNVMVTRGSAEQVGNA
ncbi:hypothetical protein G7K_1354-t1 [Saitoella complicata NRRL Y-17804]|uniref:F-box domain-containing protein n=1 Tax=Saitoella complicata (strain BCRC 22490 / CBS 7301 / JCM 7358 / NBRC 10748 / NRRL Y-17804) TaxID=698492 RepID=A0A0E9NBG1_SAICN|nr:hypothetical protein G7K_1354-t1 [Saitoella complicata NRRL Y-17804]